MEPSSANPPRRPLNSYGAAYLRGTYTLTATAIDAAGATAASAPVSVTVF